MSKKIHAVVVASAMLAGVSVAGAMPNDPDTTPGGEAFCKMYASTTARLVADALKRKSSCLDYGKGVHSDYQMHHDWCMRTPATEVEGAANHIRDLVNRCLAAGGTQGQPKKAAAGVDWIPGTPGRMSPRAVPAGTMPDGLGSFVCVGKYNGGLQPGMTGIWIPGCSFGMGGREVVVNTYSVMVGTGHWASTTLDDIPPDALQTGNEADGKPLFTCRVRSREGTFVGKTRPGFLGCNFSDRGRERKSPTFDILMR